MRVRGALRWRLIKCNPAPLRIYVKDLSAPRPGLILVIDVSERLSVIVPDAMHKFWNGTKVRPIRSRIGELVQCGWSGVQMSNLLAEDEANFKKRMRELVVDRYIAFDKFGRWRVTEKGLACLIACADRSVKINAPHERN